MRKEAYTLPAPFLKRVWLDPGKVNDWSEYPFCVNPFQTRDFEIHLTEPITIVIGENGTGKSTMLEGIAALAGYDEAGGGKGYRPVDHTYAVDKSGSRLASALKASWLPKVTTGWFFKAETFFSVARYLDESALTGMGRPPDFLSHSHGESFLRFFAERCLRRGLYIFDEPESALSPTRQITFLKLLRTMQESGQCQVIMATHSPLLMACPGAALLRLTPAGLEPVRLEDTDHFRVLREFFADPELFLASMVEDD